MLGGNWHSRAHAPCCCASPRPGSCPAPCPLPQVTDYYTIVKKPMCLKDIRNKLQRNEYATPTDMYLVRTAAAPVLAGDGLLRSGAAAR